MPARSSGSLDGPAVSGLIARALDGSCSACGVIVGNERPGLAGESLSRQWVRRVSYGLGESDVPQNAMVRHDVADHGPLGGTHGGVGEVNLEIVTSLVGFV